MGLTLMEHARVSEELGRSPLGHYVFGCQAPDAGNMELLNHFGTDEQKKKWLAPLAAGDIRSCFGMTEPDRPGSNPTWLATTARKDGNDYVIDGHKWFTTGADGAAFCIVMAVTNPDAPSHARASQIIVPMDTKGVRFVRNIPVMGHAGDGWVSHAELKLRGRARPAIEPPRRRRRGIHARARAPRSRPHPPRDALGRHLRTFLRAHVRARRDARGRARQAARHAPDDPRVDRRSPRRHPRFAAHDSSRSVEDGQRGRDTPRARRSRS